VLKDRVFALGKNCVLEIDGQEIDGVSDVSVRETIVEVDATVFNQSTTSSVVVMRSHEIQILVPDMTLARALYQKRWSKVGDYMLPGVVEAKLTGGLMEIEGRFTIHDIDADESLDGAVIPRFALRSWGHGASGGTSGYQVF
jgi:hypothetical protein